MKRVGKTRRGRVDVWARRVGETCGQDETLGNVWTRRSAGGHGVQFHKNPKQIQNGGMIQAPRRHLIRWNT